MHTSLLTKRPLDFLQGEMLWKWMQLVGGHQCKGSCHCVMKVLAGFAFWRRWEGAGKKLMYKMMAFGHLNKYLDGWIFTNQLNFICYGFFLVIFAYVLVASMECLIILEFWKAVFKFTYSFFFIPQGRKEYNLYFSHTYSIYAMLSNILGSAIQI